MDKRDTASLVYRTLRDGQIRPSMNEKRQDVLLKEHGEVCNNFRTLTDIRFKLLALLPIAAAAAVALKDLLATVSGLALSLLGLIVTLGLMTYNTRNDQLYDELLAVPRSSRGVSVQGETRIW